MKKVTAHKIYESGEIFKSNIESLNGVVTKSDQYGKRYTKSNDKDWMNKKKPEYSNFHKPILASEIFSQSMKK